jgi:hypothetical protein
VNHGISDMIPLCDWMNHARAESGRDRGCRATVSGRGEGPTEVGDPTEGEEVVGREEREETGIMGLSSVLV